MTWSFVIMFAFFAFILLFIFDMVLFILERISFRKFKKELEKWNNNLSEK